MSYSTDNIIKSILPVLLISSMLLFSGTFALAQPAEEEGEAMPELSLEEKNDRLESNLNAVVTAFIQYVKENDQTVDELGEFLGKSFAPSWPDDLTPKGLVEGMNANWQMMGIKTELLETSEDYIEGRHTIGYDEEQFNEVYGSRATFDEYMQMFGVIIQEIANYHDLTYEEYREGDWIYFTVGQKSE